jgi:hypothetical protein
MTLIIHICFILPIIASLLIVYGAWFRKFGQRYDELAPRYFSHFYRWPLIKSSFFVYYKIVPLFLLVFLIAAYILVIIRFLPKL